MHNGDVSVLCFTLETAANISMKISFGGVKSLLSNLFHVCSIYIGTIKVKLSLGLTKYRTVNTYGGVEI
jgi:hypothetical protein